MTKEEIITALRECARKVGGTPTHANLRQMTRVRPWWIQKHFSSLEQALRQAGLEPNGNGHRVKTEALLADWGLAVKKLGKLPSLNEYVQYGRYCTATFLKRFGAWGRVPDSFRSFVQSNGKEGEWGQVLELITAREQLAKAAGMFWKPEKGTEAAAMRAGMRAKPRLRFDRPVYGPPAGRRGLAYEPVTEMQVVFVFGRVAEKLGFHVERMQSEFPDCEAMREVEPGKWQRFRIEIEFASRNYAKHKHPIDGCDMIICWIHNWPECPESLEVIELREVVKGL